MSTVLSDEDMCPHNQDDEQDQPAGMCTPPTPPPPGSPIALEDDKVKTEKHCCVLKIYCYVLYILFHLYALTQLNQLYLDIMLVSLW